MTAPRRPRPPARPTTPPAEGPLSTKQAGFVAEYLIDGNAQAAARRSGYHPKHAPALLRLPAVVAAVQAGQRAHLAAAGVSKERLLQELGRIALAQAAAYFDPNTGDAKHPGELDADAGAALAGFEVLIKNAKAGDGQTDTIHKFKLWDKVRALELYMRHYGMLVDKIEVDDQRADLRVARLHAMRKRLGGR